MVFIVKKMWIMRINKDLNFVNPLVNLLKNSCFFKLVKIFIKRFNKSEFCNKYLIILCYYLS